MATFGQLKTAASKRLLDVNGTAVSNSDVADSINAAIRYWKQKRFWFNQTSGTPTLTEDDQDITDIPSDFLYELPVNGFVITYSQSRYPLTRVTNSHYDSINSEGTGLPSIYTYRDGGFQVYPYPDQSYTLSLYYIKDYDDLVDDSEENDFTTNADRLVLYDALSRLHAELRQDEKMESYYTARADLEYKNLLRRTNDNAGTGSLTVQTII